MFVLLMGGSDLHVPFKRFLVFSQGLWLIYILFATMAIALFHDKVVDANGGQPSLKSIHP